MSTELVDLALFTLAAAGAASAVILVPGVLCARALAHRGWPGRRLFELAVDLPLVLPPTAVGLVLLLLCGRAGPLGRLFRALFGGDLAFTWRAVVLASGVMAFPLLVRSVRSAFEEIDPRLVEVARTLGRGPARVFLAVELPLAWRGLLSGTLLAFARALGEFGATILVAGNIPGRTQTLALALFQRVQQGREREALAIAAVSAGLALIALAAADRFAERRERAWR